MNENEKIFQEKVLPIMDSVKKELSMKQLQEITRHTGSLSFILAGTAGPDCGISAQAACIDTLRHTGEWNSKHTEDYVQMVKDELTRNQITVTADIEKMMIDKMIKDEMPKSSIEYIMRKAASSTLFYIPYSLNKSPLENHISAMAEERYNPSKLEKGAGLALGATADYLSTGGMGGWTGAAKFVGIDMAMNAIMDEMDASENKDVPLVVAPEYREQYLAEHETAKADVDKTTRNQEVKKPEAESPAMNMNTQENEKEKDIQALPQTDDSQQEQTQTSQQNNAGGWGGFLGSVGLNGIGDIGQNLGYVLAMLPDMLVGIFTGKTRSLRMKDNLIPIASILAGMFVKNPLLKLTLIGMGGMNLLNKAGHEAMGMQAENKTLPAGRTNYRVYQNEELNARITNPEIRSNCLIATIDKVPCTIALPDKVIDAYRQGALPLNTLANAILAKNDQMRQLASYNYAASEQQSQTRTIAQR